MVARNPNNLVAFQHTDGIASDIEMFTLDMGATLAAEVAPGQAMGIILNKISELATIIAVGKEDGAGGFRVMLHGSGWTAAALESAMQGLGTTVGSGNYNASTATALLFEF